MLPVIVMEQMVRYVVNTMKERDHLQAQVTELQAGATALTLRARKAEREAEALHSELEARYHMDERARKGPIPSALPVVYVAGPFTGATPWDVEQNVRRAEALGLEVARRGAMPLIPHANTRFFYGQCTADFWYDGTLELLRRSDAVLLTPDWEGSRGARKECEEALHLGLPVQRDLAQLDLWLALRRAPPQPLADVLQLSRAKGQEP